MSKKILITGGTGFLGAYIIKELVERGYTVRALKRNSSRIPDFIPAPIWEKITWIEGDILDIPSLDEAMNDTTAVIHSAGFVSFNSGDKKELYKINMEGTANVVNMALEKGVPRMIHISSVAAIGRTTNGALVTEEKKWEENKTTTPYAKSKYKAEMEVWRGIAEGLNAVIINPSTILGYGNWQSGSTAIFRRVYEGFNWYAPGINGFVDVEDVARATVLLLESEISGQRYILNGDNWPFQQLQSSIAENFGVAKPSRYASPALMNIAWRLEKIKSFFSRQKPLLTKETAKVAISTTRFSGEKIQQALPGFSHTPLQKTIKNACDKYLLVLKTTNR